MTGLTGKFMEEKLKHGWTAEQIAQYFKISEEQFLIILKETFSSKAFKGMTNRLEKNKKIFLRKTKTTKTLTVTKTVIHETEIITEEPEVVNETVNTSTNVANQISLLEAKRSRLQALVNQLELDHKAIVSDRIKIKNSIADFKNKLLALTEEINTYQDNISSLVQKLEKKFHDMQTVTAELSHTKQKIEEINKEISSLQTISIFVYKSGTTDIVSSNEIVFSEDTYIFDKIIEFEEAEKLTLKELRNLSKTISYVIFLQNNECDFEIAFEDFQAEILFNKFINQ